MMLFQIRRAVMFSGVAISALIVAIASMVFSGHHMDRLMAQVFPSASAAAIRQFWHVPQPTATVSLNQVSSSLSGTWTTTLSTRTQLTPDHQSSCNCAACQGITV
ncbi:MAG: hypothetical protein WBA77_04905 [Microcoleaceae cyanobacterium]